MKAIVGIIGVAAFAVATSVGFAQLHAAANPLLDYCPTTPENAGTCVAAANMLLAVGNPGDDELVASVNAIAGQIQAGHVRGAACADAADAIKVLGAGIGDQSTRALVEALGATLCGGTVLGGSGGGPAIVSTSSLSTPVTGTSGCKSSSGSSGQSSGSSGESSSGSSGASSSGTSGQSSGQSLC